MWLHFLPMFFNDGTTISLFVFNHFTIQFKVHKTNVTKHGPHFHNKMMIDLATKLGFVHENLTLYYPEENGQVEVLVCNGKTWG